ncbi:short-chain dehydrogenase [Mycobacterium sp. E2327]|uniref:SDR family NAD(P)-dependent oxidoreductase n=1 Tax=Mycobacterium sp. E2327 TaxID=1834132 RepID=UPI0007FE1676|nr:SDR family oxidoreductase [Mycobacterium sp. E2327]OBI15242.1 short-chain dehydrogenase [Mycobacterium sp. E2327]
MASNVSGKVAFVTGGASGIGAALATKLVDGGAEVWIADRQIGPAQDLAQHLNRGGTKAYAIELDVRSYPSFERAVAEAVGQSGRIDYLFNNAGILVDREVDSYTLDDWNDVLDVNLRGVVHGIQAVYPIMIAQHSGHIVNTASIGGLATGAVPASYAATKHAVVGISKSLRIEAERHGVQVSVLCPGMVSTPMVLTERHRGMAPGPIERFLETSKPERFAERALRAVLRGDAIIVLPTWWKAFWYLERFSPALSMLVAKAMLKQKRRMQSTAA